MFLLKAMWLKATTTEHAVSILFVVVLGMYMYRWLLKQADSAGKEGRSFVVGFMGESRVKKQLCNLPEEIHVFYDVKIAGTHGNTDFVVVSSTGIYTIEVKNHTDGKKYNRWHFSNRQQAKSEARSLHEILVSNGIQPHWIKAVLIRADQKRMPEMRQGAVDVLGYESIGWYFREYTTNQPIKFSDDELMAVVATLSRLAGCKRSKRKMATT